MGLRTHRWAFVVLAGAGALFACNQILGVEDVKLKASGTRLNNEGGPGGDDDDDDDGPKINPQTDGDISQEDPHPILGLGFSHGCARMLDSTVRCWGSNYSGQVGDGVSLDAAAGTSPDNVLRPKTIPNINDAIAIGAGLDHTCIVRKTGKVSCWGANYLGQLGDGTLNETSVPVDVPGVDDAVAIGAGSATTCIVHRNKTASCWGANSKGGLGDGTTADSSKPVKVNDLKDIVQIAPSTNHTCAVLSSGELWCWGGAADGQLGTGSLIDTTKPTKVAALSNIVQVACASRFSCARTSTGSLFCWGRNESGQLGNGSPTSSPNPSPISVPFLTDATWVWAGTSHSCATRRTGEVMCWGEGASGQLGTGMLDANTTSSTPIAVVNIKTAKAVWTAGVRSCAITVDNKAMCWGGNSDGELGIGSTDPTATPTAISDFP